MNTHAFINYRKIMIMKRKCSKLTQKSFESEVHVLNIIYDDDIMLYMNVLKLNKLYHLSMCSILPQKIP